MPRKLDREPPAPHELRVFVKSIKFLREKKDLSQRALAKLSGLSYQYICLLESEEETISIDSMSSISHALETPLYLMLDPLLFEYSETIHDKWVAYKELLDGEEDGFYERKVLAENFRNLRLRQRYLLKEAVEHTQLNQKFLVNFEKKRCGISMNNAIKLSTFLMTSLANLLTPTKLKQTEAILKALQTNQN